MLLQPRLTVTMLVVAGSLTLAAPLPRSNYAELAALFAEWRAFEQPALKDGAPDYTPAAMAQQHAALKGWQARLAAIDPSGWPVEQQVDWHLVRAEMNGLDFRHRVLQPWARDPAFYASVRTAQSDTPAEEGPTIHHAVRLWKYSVWPRTRLDTATPLTPEAAAQLAAELRSVPPLLAQARGNLAGSNTRDLWTGAVREFRNQSAALQTLAERTAGSGDDLRGAVEAARRATDAFAQWLEIEAPKKTGPSGIGREHYTWHLRNVLLVPLTWEEEVTITRRELARSHASLRLEEHRNRDLPPLEPAADAAAFARLQDRSIRKYLDFVLSRKIVPKREYLERALRERTQAFSPEATRNFFAQATHREPMTLLTHFYHWWDTARMDTDPHPSPIRRAVPLYNIWMSRSEGLATVFEEWMMHAGLYDDNPRAREIVWIMLAKRAARGLSSLLAHDNQLTMEGAGELHVDWTPRGWMRPDLDLLGIEQLLYLRQPGYGPTYVTGGRLLDGVMADRARQLGDAFTLERFFGEIDAAGPIPVSLLRWQLTGNADQVAALAAAEAAR
ncbi:MAG TPA: DUF885 family protein [Vicinamibacterales bacterium]|nr:DUF885 family protein [Vicinamibacterales bacterium]